MKKEDFEKLIGKKVSIICNQGYKKGIVDCIFKDQLILKIKNQSTKKGFLNSKTTLKDIHNVEVIK